MRITPDILYGLLSEKYQLSRYGKGIRTQELSLPVLYEPGMQPVAGSIYVARTGDLPNRPPEGCVFICCGIKPPSVWNMWSCDVIHIVDPHTNLIGVFNVTLSVLDKLLSWEDRMQRLALEGAHVREMVEISIPIFENRITVTDYELRVLGSCVPDKTKPGMPVVMSDTIGRVPPRYISATKGFGKELLRRREPYVAEEIASEDEGIFGVSSYCINLFEGDAYLGTCAVKEEKHPLRNHERALFGMFADYVRNCLSVQANNTGNQLVTVRTVFEQILQGYPVSMREMNYAMGLVEFKMDMNPSSDTSKWCCTVIQAVRQDKELPAAYLCKTVEEILPRTTALIFDGAIVAFSLLESDTHRKTQICLPLEDYLEDMDFIAGVSRTFVDPFHARTHYRQALNAIEMSYELGGERRWHLFGDHVLDYMLQNCCGEFDAEYIVAPELVRLYHCGQSGPAYVDTLRAFLDSGCHTTQTAEAMYLHRSTLIKRLDKIREIVNLDSPERRLYLQMCLHLPDVEQVLATITDVS
ncbi:MAG: helix-turn-helix domain-containing protein [Atopobiaceae bacterium]|nr:helix-turn-helix domain-containing protein [Atopobiaceae bacterium]